VGTITIFKRELLNMRCSRLLLTVGGIVALAVYSGCSGEGSPPRAGDTVKPVLASGLDWIAGQNGEIRVRLEARNKDGSAARVLGFGGIPAKGDPVAKVVFYQDKQALSPVEVKLSHRC
jgi:hypothetical protein